MANPMAGEVALVLDGERLVLKLTLGALAELEEALGADSLVALVERFEAGRFRAKDVLAVLLAGLHGGGHAVAASVLVPGLTAYHCLVDIARLRRGEWVLVHSAAGATGQMAVRVAQMLGARVLATTSSEEKKRFLMDTFGIPEDYIFHSRTNSFARGVMRVTGGRGVDCVLNSLSGDGLRASWECMAPFGRFVDISVADINADAALPMAMFSKNVSFRALNLMWLGPDATAELLDKTMRLLGDGAIQPPQPLVWPRREKLDRWKRLKTSGSATASSKRRIAR